MGRLPHDPPALHQRRLDQPPAAPATRPVRLLAPIGYVETRFNRGVFSWRAGEIITSSDEIIHLRQKGAVLEEVEPPANHRDPETAA